MSGVSDDKQTIEPVTPDNKDPVSREAYDRAVAQRKKDRDAKLLAEQERDALKLQIEEQNEKALQEQKQFQKLYETEKAKREAADKTLSDMTTRQVTSAKQAALKLELGVTKAEYLNFAKLDDITMNEDGTPDADAVKKVANQFRKDYADLLPTKGGATLPNDAARGNGTPPAPPVKDLSKMTMAELTAEYKKTSGAPKRNPVVKKDD